jgi:hypothetical protein
MREWIIASLSVLCVSCCCAQTNVVGTWSCVETNRYGAADPRHADETYVTTTRFQFATNGTITVTANTPRNIQRTGIINTKHAGTYLIEGNQLTITAREITGYRERMWGLNDSYSFGWDGQVLILANKTSGKVRYLTQEQRTEPTSGGDVATRAAPQK